MQTFAPYTSLERCAEVLDDRRLFNQVNECKAIMKALVTGKGWVHHPATKMWAGHEQALMRYAIEMAKETANRGRPNHGIDDIIALAARKSSHYADPPWWGEMVVHLSHRSNLLRKNPSHYAEFATGVYPVGPNVEYAWPEIVRTVGREDSYRLRLSGPGVKRVETGEYLDPREVFADFYAEVSQ